MRRREFITTLASAVVTAAWPPGARAQQPAQRRIGVLMQYAEGDPEGQIRAKALTEELEKLGWKASLNLRIDYRWAGGDRDRFRSHAADLVKLKDELVVAVSTPAVKALQRESKTIPIVFTQVSDPIGQDMVESLAKPGGAVTGFTNYDRAIGGKWLELLKQVSPTMTRTAVVFNPQTAPYTELYMRSIESAAPSYTVGVTAAQVHDAVEIKRALTEFASVPGGGLIVMTDAFTSVHRKQIIDLAARLGLPAVYPYRYYVADGGLMSYGIDQIDQIRGAALYVDRILKGERPGDLPVQAPTKFQLVVNLKTAKALGLKISESFLLRADEVVE
jgi:putative ABC transport system substrate-binding protein